MEETTPLLENDENDEYEESNESFYTNECRICKEPMTDEEYRRYCGCNGYISYIHYDCLNTWIRTSHRTQCEFCEEEYSYESKISCKIFWHRIYTSGILFMSIPLYLLIYILFPNKLMYAKDFIDKLTVLLIISYVLCKLYINLKWMYNRSKLLILVPFSVIQV